MRSPLAISRYCKKFIGVSVESLAMYLDSTTTTTTSNPSPDIPVRDYNSVEEMQLLADPYPVYIFILYTFTIFTAFALNSASILVLAFGKRVSRELRAYLISLSLLNMSLALFSSIFTISHFINSRWIFPPWLCQPVQFAQMTSAVVHINTVVVIGVDRFIAIHRPLLRVRQLTRYLINGAIWLFAILIGALHSFHTQVVPFRIHASEEIFYDCIETWSTNELAYYTLIIHLITFAIPELIILTVYGLIASKVLNRSAPGELVALRDEILRKECRHIILVIFLVCFTFTLLWSPYQLWMIAIYLFPVLIQSMDRTTYTIVTILFHWLCVFNAVANPLIYCVIGQNFRDDAVEVFPRTGRWLRDLPAKTWLQLQELGGELLTLGRFCAGQCRIQLGKLAICRRMFGRKIERQNEMHSVRYAAGEEEKEVVEGEGEKSVQVLPPTDAKVNVVPDKPSGKKMVILADVYSGASGSCALEMPKEDGPRKVKCKISDIVMEMMKSERVYAKKYTKVPTIVITPCESTDQVRKVKSLTTFDEEETAAEQYFSAEE